MHFGGLAESWFFVVIKNCVHNYQNVILTVRRWRMWVYSLECRSVCRTSEHIDLDG